jgi:hypothetical protein
MKERAPDRFRFAYLWAAAQGPLESSGNSPTASASCGEARLPRVFAPLGDFSLHLPWRAHHESTRYLQRTFDCSSGEPARSACIAADRWPTSIEVQSARSSSRRRTRLYRSKRTTDWKEACVYPSRPTHNTSLRFNAYRRTPRTRGLEHCCLTYLRRNSMRIHGYFPTSPLPAPHTASSCLSSS